MSTPSTFDTLDPARQAIAYRKAAERVAQVRSAVLPVLQQIQAEIKKRTRYARLLASIPVAFLCFLKPSRYKGAHGGRGSAKSQTFARLLLLRCINEPGLRVVCVREVQKSLEQSVKRLLEDLITLYEYGDVFKVLNTHIETPGGGIIIFQGMQNHTAQSIKSLEGYKIAWVEEASSLSATSLELLRPTMRMPGSEIWFTWNPDQATDPVDAFLRGPVAPPDGIVIEANYRDNPHLPKELQTEMDWDFNRDVDKYNHIWLGQYNKKSEARVFKNWRVEEFETPSDASLLHGGDWGFATDPTVAVRGFVKNRTLYIDYEAYAVGCEIDDTAALFDSIGCTQQHEHGKPYSKCTGSMRRWDLIADSARPETISYLQRHGYPRIIPAKKGAGSVEDGLSFLKNYDIVVHPRCKHVKDELTMYSYKVDRLTGQVTNVLEDKKNHTIDSLRYAVEKLRTATKQKVEVL